MVVSGPTGRSDIVTVIFQVWQWVPGTFCYSCPLKESQGTSCNVSLTDQVFSVASWDS